MMKSKVDECGDAEVSESSRRSRDGRAPLLPCQARPGRNNRRLLELFSVNSGSADIAQKLR
jgi:hypothetical protein